MKIQDIYTVIQEDPDANIHFFISEWELRDLVRSLSPWMTFDPPSDKSVSHIIHPLTGVPMQLHKTDGGCRFYAEGLLANYIRQNGLRPPPTSQDTKDTNRK